MGSDNELPEDEEEIFVYVEFEGPLDGNVFSQEQLQLDMIGIDTEHPIMQINGKFYEGTYEDVNGTYMFFTKNDTSVVDDPVFDVAPDLKYFAKSKKFLKMQRVFMKPRTEVLGDSEHCKCIPNLDTLKQAGVPHRYQTEALSFWKTMRNNRLKALNLYLEKQRIRQQKKSQGIMLESDSDEDNPFAIYRHKEEFGSTNVSEDICGRLEDEQNYSDSKLYSKFKFPKEIASENADVAEEISEDNLKELKNLIEAQSSVSKDHGSCRVKSIKTYKTKTSQKKNISKVHNAQRIKNRNTRILSKDKTSLLDNKHKESLNIEKKSEELNKYSVTESVNTLDITEGENEMLNEEHIAALIERSKMEANQIDSTNSKTIKQLKREAKMKEILEKLKAIAEENTNTAVN
ncbi:uncharacterized protein LOC122398564 [Colletes gigas]|uniref:uncharacterized protein LOC122398564 n=1 Tax=Colletes gigas TaxID=935657 RepID=UPI001C9BAE81|nr:uncharacterized protein LOC122398564 [Colletes gigas]